MLLLEVVGDVRIVTLYDLLCATPPGKLDRRSLPSPAVKIRRPAVLWYTTPMPLTVEVILRTPLIPAAKGF